MSANLPYIPRTNYVAVRNRARFEEKANAWCHKNQIGFFGTNDKITAVNHEKIVKITICDLISGRDELIQLDTVLGRNGQHMWWFCDNFVDMSKLSDLKHVTVIPDQRLLGIYPKLKIKKTHTPSRLFNCFINRVEMVRQTWMYLLYHHDLLRKGYVSFLLDQHHYFSDLLGIDLFDWIHKNHNLGIHAHFEKAYQKLRYIVPYRNFDDTPDIYQLLSDSKYSLILETYATEDNHLAISLTEKTFRSCQAPSINLFFAQKKAMLHLSTLGFEIPPCVLEIDDLDWTQRQQKLLEIINKDTIVFDAELLYNSAIHNNNIISEYRQKMQDTLFLEEIFSGVIDA